MTFADDINLLQEIKEAMDNSYLKIAEPDIWKKYMFGGIVFHPQLGWAYKWVPKVVS